MFKTLFSSFFVRHFWLPGSKSMGQNLNKWQESYTVHPLLFPKMKRVVIVRTYLGPEVGDGAQGQDSWPGRVTRHFCPHNIT
jgi:hypothetical protein